MAFHNVRLSEDIEKGAQGGPSFKTTVMLLSSGKEKRNIDWERTRGRWDISYGIDTKANHEEVLAFFYAREGRAHGFRFKDWTDFEIGSAGSPQVIGTGDASVDKFQIKRRYTSGSTTFEREVTRIVAASYSVYVDAVLQTETTHYTLDVDTGIIDFVSAPGSGLDVSVICEFDVPVRFENDELVMTAARDDVYALPSINIVELKEALGSLA